MPTYPSRWMNSGWERESGILRRGEGETPVGGILYKRGIDDWQTNLFLPQVVCSANQEKMRFVPYLEAFQGWIHR